MSSLAPASTLPQANHVQGITYAKPADGTAVNVDSVREIVKGIVPHAKDVAAEAIEIRVVVGGITNALFKATFTGPGDEPLPAVLVRVFGGEGMIDRDLENATFVALSDSGVGPQYYGRFGVGHGSGSGRVEGWIDGAKDLTLAQMAAPEVMVKVASEMAKLHRYVLPAPLQPYYSKPGMWSQLWSWFEQAKRDCAGGNTIIQDKWGADVATRWGPIQDELVGADFSKAESALKDLQASIPSNAMTVFAHNDLLAGNIMLHEETGKIHLIDFEYGGCNFRGFDIANHWNEWAGGTQTEMNGAAEYDRFPNSDQQRAFCISYIEEAGLDMDGLDDLMEESNKFVLANHWYWGLWAVNQTVMEGTDGFDYIRYAQSRIGQFWKLKQSASSL